MKYDFGGWATKNDLRCADGRIIRKDAFKVNDGKKVPLVWNHQHKSASDVLGHAMLENRPEGVYAYCRFNGTSAGKDAKEAVRHGDVTALSIWANNLQQVGSEVIHGAIREVSLVLAGANPGAFIESVLAHGEPMDDGESEGIFYTDDSIHLEHSLEDDIYLEHSEENEEEDDDVGDDKTVKEVFDTLNDEQKKAVAIIIGQALEDAQDQDYDNEEEDEEEEMKHNIFDNDENDETTYLSHADIQEIFAEAKRTGSLKEAVTNHFGDDVALMHSINTTGMTVATGTQTYGFNDPSMLFPEYRTVNGNTPEWISRNMDWVQKVMGGVQHSPFSRIKSLYADITEDEARARGYIKGKQKKEEVFTTLKRTTDPQTVYKKQKMDRDDIIDIIDFDVVVWIRAEMRLMLNEELARAILIGDGRPTDSDDKIQESHIRPIATDVPLFNTKVEVPGDTEEELAKNMIRYSVKSRKKYKGSGNPTLFTTEDYLTEMLLLEDNNGRRMYDTVEKLATAMRVSSIETVEPMEGQKVDDKELLGIIVNLRDYRVGADKGGEINVFDDFDIDYNQHKYLIETRVSGALVKPFSAITLLRSGKSSTGGSGSGTGSGTGTE